MSDQVVFFHQACAPYVAGDIAGFSSAHAQALVDRGVASIHPPIGPAALPAEGQSADEFGALDRAQLVAFAAAHFGVTDVPAAEVTDDQLREALRSGTAPATAPAAKPAKAKA